MDPFSARTRFATEENALTRAVTTARAMNRELWDLTPSNPTELGLSPAREAIAAALTREDVSRYAPEPFGLLEARRAISADCTRRGLSVPAEQILLTSSTSEAYGYLFKLLCDPGDAVLVPAPSYPLLDVLAVLENVRLVPYRLQYDGEWHLDRTLIALAKDSGARAVVTVHPNNPTGSFLKRSELAILAECGLPVLSDEVFASYDLSQDPDRVQSLLELTECLVFAMGGLSKALALPQLKLAWTACSGPAPLVKTALDRLAHIADAYLSPSTPVQRALPHLLAHAPDIGANILARCERNLQTLRLLCASESALSLLRVEGGWYAIVRVPALMDEEAWCLSLLGEEGVLCQPGYFYELSGGAHLVLSLITQENVFAEGVSRMVRRVRATLRA